MVPPPAVVPRRTVDETALRRVRRRLLRAAAAPWLHGEVARRMAERLPVVRLQPARLLDWHARLSASADLLQAAYPRAERVAVEPAREVAAVPAPGAGSAAPAAPWWSPARWRGASPPGTPSPCADDALPPGGAQLVWANMALHGVADPPAEIQRWHRALATDGFLMFSTLGPGTLPGLLALYRARGWPPPLAPFVDMHDLGDMLVEAGFADPVMDQETLTLTWPDGDALLAELRALGGNCHPRRWPGLRTARWRHALARALEDATAGPDGRPALAFEVVYGHAFKPLPRPRVAGVTAIDADDLRTLARAGRPRRGPGA